MNSNKEQAIRELFAKIGEPMNYHDMDGFSPADWSGGNYDDAFDMGYSEGRALLAQEILRILDDTTAKE